MNDPVIHYHEQSKHHLHRYARSAGYMDWQNQPNPFRFWHRDQAIRLPLLKDDPQPEHAGLYEPSSCDPQSLGIESLAGFLELSLGLSAWKVMGNQRWSLRINPSSGNLHPTEAHLILAGVNGIPSGMYHYSPFLHALEPRSRIDPATGQLLHNHFDSKGFLIGLTSIFWRESWKYGERAYRYCNHDVGHALAALAIAANLLGWQLTCLNGMADSQMEMILGFDRTEWPPLEEEHPDVMCFINVEPNPAEPPRLTMPASVIQKLQAGPFIGHPSPLSRNPVDWKIIYETARRTRMPATDGTLLQLPDLSRVMAFKPGLKASHIIRQRRSATAFDPDRPIQHDQFVAVLEKTLPRKNLMPFDCQLTTPNVHLLIFVHNVTDLPRGLYLLCRRTDDLKRLQADLHPEFAWRRLNPGLPLYLLKEDDLRADAIQVSCHQEIAGYSAFSMGMLARFDGLIQSAPFRYRLLFWETGMIGQVLYLEAEAQGLRGTGIGCFFDDAVHRIAGIKNNAWQSLYHFTLGYPIEDSRLSSLPPYSHLDDGR